MPRPKKKLINDNDTGLTTGPSQEFWQNRLNQINQIRNRGQAEPPTVVRRVLDEPLAPEGPPPQRMIPEVPRLRVRPPEFRAPNWVDPNRAPVNEPAPVARPPSLPRPPVARPPSLPRPPVAIRRPIIPNIEPDFEPNLEYPEWTEPIQEFAFNAGRTASTAGRAVATAAEAAGVAAGETLGGIGGAIGLEGGAAILAGGGIIGAGVLAAGLLGYGIYLLGKRLHDKFKAAHDKHGQEAALAALARQVESNRALKIKFEKNLSPEDMDILNDHIPLHTEIDLGTAKRKKPEQIVQKDVQQEKEEKRVFADDSSSSLHNMHKQSQEITPAPKISEPSSDSSTTTTTPPQSQTPSTPTVDKQMFQPPEPEKPINVTPQQPQQRQQTFQDNSHNTIRPLNSQQPPRLTAEQYQYVRQRDPGYMV